MERDAASTVGLITKPRRAAEQRVSSEAGAGWNYSRAQSELMNNSEEVGELGLWTKMNSVFTHQLYRGPQNCACLFSGP